MRARENDRERRSEQARMRAKVSEVRGECERERTIRTREAEQTSESERSTLILPCTSDTIKTGDTQAMKVEGRRGEREKERDGERGREREDYDADESTTSKTRWSDEH